MQTGVPPRRPPLPARPAARPAPRHWQRSTWALGAGIARTSLPAAPERRQRQLVRSAADLLWALGVRVDVTAPATAWPRGGRGRLVVATDAGLLGTLALLTAVRGVRGVGPDADPAGRQLLRTGALAVDPSSPGALAATAAAVGERLTAGTTVVTALDRRWTPALAGAAVAAGAPICPVAVTVSTGAGEPVDPDALRDTGTVRRAAAADGLVVAVRLLSALDCPPADTMGALDRAEVLPRVPAPRQHGAR